MLARESKYQLINGELIRDANKLSEIERTLLLKRLRNRREQECFPIINRGSLWYAHLTEEQINELNAWYSAWLDVTETLEVPEYPEWLEEV